MKITMDGKYAYRDEPRVQVRVLCTDAPGSQSVISMTPCGTIHYHHADGRWICQRVSGIDLVPLDESLVVTPGVYETRHNGAAYVVYVRQEKCEFPAIGFLVEGGAAEAWSLGGEYVIGQKRAIDLVRRIGDLP